MAWDGSGTFNRTDGSRRGRDVWAQARDAGALVNAADSDTHDNDLADGLENCLTRDGQTAPIQDLPMSGFKLLNCGEATEDNQYATLAQVRDQSSGDFIQASDVGGTGDVIALTVSPAPITLTPGLTYTFFAKETNTRAVNIVLSSRAAVPLVRANGTPIAPGEITPGRYLVVVYNGQEFRSNVTAEVSEVENPFTDADESKLDGIEDNATRDQTGTEIRNLLNGLSGTPSLDVNAAQVDGLSLWRGTQAQYDAISSKDNSTVYIITG